MVDRCLVLVCLTLGASSFGCGRVSRDELSMITHWLNSATRVVLCFRIVRVCWTSCTRPLGEFSLSIAFFPGVAHWLDVTNLNAMLLIRLVGIVCTLCATQISGWSSSYIDPFTCIAHGHLQAACLIFLWLEYIHPIATTTRAIVCCCVVFTDKFTCIAYRQRPADVIRRCGGDRVNVFSFVTCCY